MEKAQQVTHGIVHVGFRTFKVSRISEGFEII